MYDNLLGKRNCITWFYEALCPLTPVRVIVVLAPIGFDQISVRQMEKGPGAFCFAYNCFDKPNFLVWSRIYISVYPFYIHGIPLFLLSLTLEP